MKEEVSVLKNGIRTVRQSCSGEVCCCGFAIGAGTRDETDNEQGIAHFTEHMLFKGTHRRNAWHILNRLGAVGGEINAYTTKEEIFLYAICLKKDYERALELMCDMLFHSSFPASEIENEREVILDEINVYEDSPSELIYDDFERILYSPHPFGRNILGSADCLARMDTAAFQIFTSRCFTTDRLVYFSLSPLEPEREKRLINKYLDEIPDSSSRSVSPWRTRPVLATGLHENIDRQTHQAHVLYGNEAYSLFDDRRLTLYLLNNYLGGPGMNSLLNNTLRERYGLVYTVESSVNSYSDTGLFAIYFGADARDVDRCLVMIDRTLRQLREKPLSTYQLRAAKKQLCGQLAIAAENKESQALSMGKSVLYYNCFESTEQLFSKIEALQPADLLAVANEVFEPSHMSLLTYR
ncbi:MAG: insulinase family protein [Bacteroidales bacterium]|nr:insulinase family protein [Bacteroidales bacterium]